MSVIDRYHLKKNGQYDVVVRDVSLNRDALQLLDNDVPVDVVVKIIDVNSITDKQRRKIFALINDIYLHTGQPHEDLRMMFQSYLQFMNGYEHISLSDTTRKIASELIELIIEFIFAHNIPLNYRTSDLLKADRYFIYHATINRKCVICGKENSDLAHRHAVGRGRNRNNINHFDNQVLALCREHHTEQHNIGIESFNDKYHLHDSWIDVDEKLNKMLRGG